MLLEVEGPVLACIKQAMLKSAKNDMSYEAALCPAVVLVLSMLLEHVLLCLTVDWQEAFKDWNQHFTWQAAKAVEVASAPSSAPSWRQLLQSLLPGHPAVPRQRLQGTFDQEHPDSEPLWGCQHGCALHSAAVVHKCPSSAMVGSFCLALQVL